MKLHIVHSYDKYALKIPKLIKIQEKNLKSFILRTVRTLMHEYNRETFA